MIVAAIGILLSIAGMFMVKCKEGATQKQLLKCPAGRYAGQFRADSDRSGHMAAIALDYLGHFRFGCFRPGSRCDHWSDHRILYLR